MAKSLRSKWKRKMKAVKRVRYGEKEKKALQKIVETAAERIKKVEAEHEPQVLGNTADDSVQMETEASSKKSTVNAKTLRDDHGTYPVWVSKRKVAKMKKTKNKTTKHVEGKIVKKKGVQRKKRF